jgi:predicted metalloprotease with PDZ domain
MPPAISYTIAMPRPQTHLYEVTLTINASDGPTLDVALPVWTPGSYMVREYARHVQEFAATAGGRALPWRKLDKSTWRIEATQATPISISYKVYANELSVRTSHLDSSHGYFNPATVCMYIPGRTAEPAAVHVIAPDGWRVTTGLQTDHDSDDGRSFVAQDYDELVDAPFECGTHRLLRFDVDGIPHDIALWGHGNEDADRIVADTQKIVVAARDFFGGLPYARYTFIVHLSSERGGGLEHRNSVTMLINRWSFQPNRSYERYLQLTSHEFFHVWNVKRIRAAPLGPFDYSRENYTRQLWAMEGVTEYYTDILLLRAGLITPERYRELLAEAIASLQSQPGRAQQSLEQSSFDAWIKLYRPDENTLNSAISYYLKGAQVALLLDLEIRQRTASERSLDDVLRYLYRTYPIDGPGIPEDGGYRAAVEAVVSSATAPGDARSFATFFARFIAGTDELDYDRALGYAGLRLDWSHERRPEDGRAPAWLGLKLKTENGRPKVSAVLSDSPAYLAGIAAGDELLALDGYRTSEDDLNARLAERRPGERVTLTVFRREELLNIPVTLVAAPYDKLALRPMDTPTAEQRQLYLRWIGAELPSADTA